MSKLKKNDIDHLTRFNVKPRIDAQLLGLSDECLILHHFSLRLGLTFGWVSTWLFWVLGLPTLVYLIVAPWLPPYGYRDGIEITSFYEKITGYPIIEIFGNFLFSIILGGIFIGILLGFGYAHLRRSAKNYSPIIFDRKSNIVYTYCDGSRQEVGWSDLRVSFRNAYYTSGFVPSRREVVYLDNLGEHTLIEEGLPAKGLDDEVHTSAEAIWEFIRHFMNEGPEALKVPINSFSGFDNLYQQPFYSYAFMESVAAHWFWPLFRTKDRHAVTIFFTLFCWPLKVLFFVPNILTDWLWRKISLSKFRDSPATPNSFLRQCEGLITSTDAKKYIEEAVGHSEYVDFLELKKWNVNR